MCSSLPRSGSQPRSLRKRIYFSTGIKDIHLVRGKIRRKAQLCSKENKLTIYCESVLPRPILFNKYSLYLSYRDSVSLGSYSSWPHSSSRDRCIHNLNYGGHCHSTHGITWLSKRIFYRTCAATISRLHRWNQGKWSRAFPSNTFHLTS